jgi:hypothetical protein
MIRHVAQGSVRHIVYGASGHQGQANSFSDTSEIPEADAAKICE